MIFGAAAAFAVAGCVQRVQAPAAGQAASGSAPVELVLYVWNEVTELQANQALVAEFEQQHPEIKVRVQNVPGSREAMQKLQTMIAAGTPPDVMALHGAYFLPFAAKGALLDLEPFLAKDKEFNVGDIYPRLRDICRWQGKLYSLPRYSSVLALIYNKALFDAAGVPYPGKRKSWTWDDYLATCKKLTTAPGANQKWGAYIDFYDTRLYPWLWQNGANILSDDKKKCVIDSPQAVEAVRFVSDLRLKYGVCPPTTVERNEGLNMLMAGKVAMFMGGPWDVQTLLRQPTLEWEVAPLPTRKTAATLLGTENYAIAAGSKHPQEAWELFKFLLSPHAQEYMATKLDRMPSRKSVAEGAYLAAPAKYNRKVFVDAISYGQTPLNIPQWDEASHYLKDQFDLIWVGKKSVQQGLQDAAESVDKVLAKGG
jgi:multiple sugar transport system substrate-binding protein